MFRALPWLAAVLLTTSLPAADDDVVSRLNRIGGTEATADDWQWAARTIADKQLRSDIRIAILGRDPYPRKELVQLLSHPHLAVRLGALELLEEAAGDSYGLNAWASPTGEGTDPRNVPALELWEQWAGQTGTIKAAGNLLSDEQMQAYIADIVSGNEDRKRRAIRMLEPRGLKGVTAIQEFITRTAALAGNSRINLKEAQYHLVLAGTSGENAAVLARDLTVGNRDQQLAAISALKKSGLLAIPIVRDFLDSDDPLVRETAVDTILILGGAQTAPLVIPHLKDEPDANVIHAAMRRFREIGGAPVRDAITAYLDREDEDLVVSAVESLTKICGSSDSFSSMGSVTTRASGTPEITAKIVALLDDPRWRIRSAALEFVAKTSARDASEKVIALLGDEDEFVRSQAIAAAVALGLTKAKARLTRMFLDDDDMIAPATEALTGMGIVLPAELVAHLDTRPPDIVVGALKALNRDQKPFLDIVARYATNPDLDIACAALRSLGDDSDKLKFEFAANHLTTALQSGVDEKIQAVLDSVSLPTKSSSSYYSSSYIVPSQPGTSLDSLYDAFIKPNKPPGSTKPVDLAPAKDPEAEGGIPALKDALASFVTSWENPGRAFAASLILAKSGDPRGLTALTKRIDQLSVSERAAIADGLYGSQPPEAVPLLRALMQDKVSDVRRDAADRAFNNRGDEAMIEMAFQQLDVPGTPLTADELYGYGLESSASDQRGRRKVLEWCRNTLASEDTGDETTILALIMMREVMETPDIPTMETFTKSSGQWIRRAAWYSISRTKPAWMSRNTEALASDPSPKVRVVLPMALNHESAPWTHWFSDNKTARNRTWSSSSQKTRITPEQEDALRSLAEGDPSEEVRFESWFALLAHGKRIDLPEFIRLIPRQPKEATVPERLANHLESNYRRMGRGMKALLAYSDVSKISKSKLPLVLKHFTQGDEGSSFTSFEALAAAAEPSTGPQTIETDDDPGKMAAARQRLVVVVFHKPGCKECDKVERYLRDMKNQFPLMELDRRNITDQRDVLVNQALCDRFQVSGQGKTPSIFTQAGALIAPATEPEAIARLLRDTMEMPDDPAWNTFGSEDIEVARERVDETFANLTLSIVLGAGLLDGVNPCAFATIIFLLSYLQVARRSPREILMVGIAFIAAVFLAYFSVGIVFHGLVEWLNNQPGFGAIRTGMTWLFAGFAFLVAVLSLRDGIRARRGHMQDMTLQLPAFLKDRIRGVIRRGARSRSYVIAAFASGIVISFLELACTGQVYAPIVFQIQQGSLDAVRYLLYYNFAFIAPLVLVFLLAYRGMTSAALIRFQEKHTAAVKFATASLFFLLVLVIFFGDRIIPVH